MDFLEFIKVLNVATSIYLLVILFKYNKCNKINFVYLFILLLFLYINTWDCPSQFKHFLINVYDTSLVIFAIILFKKLKKWKQ